MNGIHDMGGMTDFGHVVREADEPVFHAPWEERVLGMVRNTVDVHYNWDEFRYAIERIEPVTYLSVSYYERWLTALERFLVQKQVVGASELRERAGESALRPGVEPVSPDEDVVRSARSIGAPSFSPGQRVRARSVHPSGHTRLPRYARGKAGVIERYLGEMVFPDSNALGLGESLQPVYAVRFAARELWGDAASPYDSVCIDLWEGYLESASEA